MICDVSIPKLVVFPDIELTYFSECGKTLKPSMSRAVRLSMVDMFFLVWVVGAAFL